MVGGPVAKKEEEKKSEAAAASGAAGSTDGKAAEAPVEEFDELAFLKDMRTIIR